MKKYYVVARKLGKVQEILITDSSKWGHVIMEIQAKNYIEATKKIKSMKEGK